MEAEAYVDGLCHVNGEGGARRARGVRESETAGFTLVELMVIVMIIGILLVIAVASYVPATRSAAAAACRSNRRVLNEAAAVMRSADEGPRPRTLNDLEPYVKNFASVGVCPEDGVALRYDPMTGDVSCPNHP